MRRSPLKSFATCLTLLTVASHAAAQRPIVVDEATPALISDQFGLPDGAAWDGSSRLFVPDVKAKKLLQFDSKTLGKKPRELNVEIAISGTCFQLGRLYLADNRNARIAVWDRGRIETIAQFAKDERPNDLTVDAEGNVFTTITAKGIVTRVDAGGNLTTVAQGLERPNGIALSPSGKRLYVSSFSTGVIYRIAVDEDKPSVEAFAQLPNTDDGFRGDGMCIDRAGNVYVTGASAVHVFDADGQSLTSIPLPHRPINAIVGGADARTLFVSTFGGLFALPLNEYGVSPNKPVAGPDSSPTSTAIPPTIRARFNTVFTQDGSRELLMDVFTPANPRGKKPAIVVVHGGGWKQGDKTKFRALALRLAEKGYVTAAIEYRLAGEAAFPAAIRDCNAATAFLRDNAERYEIDPQRIAAVGGSAGGHLVGLMAAGTSDQRLQHPADRQTDTRLQAAVVLAGPLEIATGMVAERSLAKSAKSSSNAVLWMEGNVTEKKELYQLADAYEKVDASMPPTLFLCGSEDNPGRNAKTREKMKSLGAVGELVIHEGAKHGHWNRPDWIERVVDDIVTFLDKHL
ncbi:MAG: SMP-30/gluconolactonase/LRE family protein [Planctomycetota bacterium]